MHGPAHREHGLVEEDDRGRQAVYEPLLLSTLAGKAALAFLHFVEYNQAAQIRRLKTRNEAGRYSNKKLSFRTAHSRLFFNSLLHEGLHITARMCQQQ